MNKYIYTKQLGLIFAFVLAANVFCFSQTGKNSAIDEKNVRAGMTFLAGDAMQGRGSGTIFERIAAEYVGSQFMQFGLEPAGDKGAGGIATYVQTVEVPGRPALQNLQFGRLGNPLELGKDWIVISISAKDITGDFKKISLSESARAGEVVLITPNEDDKLETIQPRINQFFADGAAAVLVTETKELRERWAEIAARKPATSRRGTLIAVSKATAGLLSSMSWQSPFEMHATFSDPPNGATWNAVGKITGYDKTLGSEVIVLSSHLDHLGVRENAPGDDKIFNGADDDASGTVAVLELARILAAGQKPKRTIYFVCFGSEEAGGFGSRFFAANLPFPKEKFVANLQFEMIGRPDAKVKSDELWLTGYERSDLGPELAKRGAKLVQDPHPKQNFFQRSDNIHLARQGIIAHTVSSFGLHADYHKASDEIKTIDFAHMTRSINSMIEPIKWLVNSTFTPAWNEGGRP